MIDISPEIQSLVEFILRGTFFDDQTYFYSEIDSYLKKQFKATPLEIYSIHAKEGHSPFRRKVWAAENQYSNFEKLEKIDLKSLRDEKFVFFDDDLLGIMIGDLKDHVKVIVVNADPFKEKKDYLQVFTKYLESTFKNVKKIEEIKSEVSLIDIDDVTGLYNSRRLHKDLSEGIKRYEDTGERFSLLFIDIDHFKNVNDGHGHLIGTGLLGELAKELKKILRLYDHLYRYGGDEFVILLPKADSINAKQIGDRVLEAVTERTFIPKKGEKEFKLSLSIGIASFPDHASTAEDLLALADKMMYHAKELGRGRVCLVNEIFDKKTG